MAIRGVALGHLIKHPAGKNDKHGGRSDRPKPRGRNEQQRARDCQFKSREQINHRLGYYLWQSKIPERLCVLPTWRSLNEKRTKSNRDSGRPIRKFSWTRGVLVRRATLAALGRPLIRPTRGKPGRPKPEAARAPPGTRVRPEPVQPRVLHPVFGERRRSLRRPRPPKW